MTPHFLEIKDAKKRNVLLEQLGITDGVDMYGMASRACLEQLIDAWVGQMGNGWSGCREDLFSDMEILRDNFNAALVRLETYLQQHSVPQ